VLAVGDLFEVVRGDRVTSRLIFRFKDGSVDDETTVGLILGDDVLIEVGCRRNRRIAEA
jgi:hypothetical protein